MSGVKLSRIFCFKSSIVLFTTELVSATSRKPRFAVFVSDKLRSLYNVVKLFILDGLLVDCEINIVCISWSYEGDLKLYSHHHGGGGSDHRVRGGWSDGGHGRPLSGSVYLLVGLQELCRVCIEKHAFFDLCLRQTDIFSVSYR